MPVLHAYLVDKAFQGRMNLDFIETKLTKCWRVVLEYPFIWKIPFTHSIYLCHSWFDWLYHFNSTFKKHFTIAVLTSLLGTKPFIRGFFATWGEDVVDDAADFFPFFSYSLSLLKLLRLLVSVYSMTVQSLVKGITPSKSLHILNLEKSSVFNCFMILISSDLLV